MSYDEVCHLQYYLKTSKVEANFLGLPQKKSFFVQFLTLFLT